MTKRYLLSLLLYAFVCSACESYLGEKPDKKLAVPSTLRDLQALLDDNNRLAFTPSAGEASADDYFVTYEDWSALVYDEDRRMHIWEKDYLFMPLFNAWSDFGMAVHYANTVLEVIKEMDSDGLNESDVQNVRGQAHFLRGKALYDAAVIWALAYDDQTANTDLGLPLRLNTDFNEPSVRSNLESTYQQILSDLKLAAQDLPSKSIHVIRPSKQAAYALLSRVYLSMRKYKEAELYADSCLQIGSNLIDYNTLDRVADFPFRIFNEEVILESGGYSVLILNPIARIKPLFYELYDENDLRKHLFFNVHDDDRISFKGNYRGDGFSFFGGMAVNEVLLNRAECRARTGDITGAITDLNTLLRNRWKEGEFVPITIEDEQALINNILIERRKELLMRGLRWSDIKRLNKEGANITLTRELGGITYTLPPNDLRFALPIPEDVIEFSGMEQNPR